MCGFCTVWMCEAYVILWVGIWWVLSWCGCIEFLKMYCVVLYTFLMCRGVYVWVFYCMDV